MANQSQSLFELSKTLEKLETSSGSKGGLNEIKSELEKVLNHRNNITSIDHSKLSSELNNIKQKASKCDTSNRGHVKNIIYNTFFDGELSSYISDDEEMQDDLMVNNNHMQMNHEQLRVPPLNNINSSLLNTINQHTDQRERIMSENIDLNNSNKDQTFSLFDLLINNRRQNPNVQNNMGLGQFLSDPIRDASESSNLSSSLIENLLTDYLISLPSSLEEFHKIMGEIYVAEIMRQCPSISSPTELMKQTLLGNHVSQSNGMSTGNVMNTLVQHILQLNRRPDTGINTLESDIMRKLLSENPPPKPSAYPSFDNPKATPSFQPLKFPKATFNSEEAKTHTLNSTKTQGNQKRRIVKQDAKLVNPRPKLVAMSESISSSKNDELHQIYDHIPLLERAKRLLRKREACQNDSNLNTPTKSMKIDHINDISDIVHPLQK